MVIAPKKEKCKDMHLFDIQMRVLGIRCRCGKYKQDFDYLTGRNLTMRVRIHTKKPINFKGVN